MRHNGWSRAEAEAVVQTYGSGKGEEPIRASWKKLSHSIAMCNKTGKEICIAMGGFSLCQKTLSHAGYLIVLSETGREAAGGRHVIYLLEGCQTIC